MPICRVIRRLFRYVDPGRFWNRTTNLQQPAPVAGRKRSVEEIGTGNDLTIDARHTKKQRTSYEDDQDPEKDIEIQDVQETMQAHANEEPRAPSNVTKPSEMHESDIIMADSVPGLHDTTSPSITDRASSPSAPPTPAAADWKFDIGDPTVTRYENPFLEEKLAQRLQDKDDLQVLGWTPEDAKLFLKLRFIDLDPLLPYTWVWDFLTLPNWVFTVLEEEHKALIQPTYRNKKHTNADVKCAKALVRLFDIGPLARDDVILGIDPRKKMERELKRYVKWSHDEAGILQDQSKPPHNFIVETGTPTEDVVDVQRRLLVRFNSLSQDWKTWAAACKDPVVAETLRYQPLYGIVCRGKACAVVAYYPGGNEAYPHDSPDRYMVPIGAYDWGSKDLDVESSLSLALVVAHCRDLLLHAVDQRACASAGEAEGAGGINDESCEDKGGNQ